MEIIYAVQVTEKGNEHITRARVMAYPQFQSAIRQPSAIQFPDKK
jgi:hypothetical protein